MPCGRFDEGRVPSRTARLAPRSAIPAPRACARSTRMDHAMSDRHTAVVSDPPIFVMCMAMAPAHAAAAPRRRATAPRPRARAGSCIARWLPRRKRRGGWENISPSSPVGLGAENRGVGSRVARPTSMRRFFWFTDGRSEGCRVVTLILLRQGGQRSGKTSLLGDDARGSLHRAKASSFEP